MIKAFNEKRWADALAADYKTNLSDSLILDWIGYCYDNGFGVTANKEEVTKWYKKAADWPRTARIARRWGCAFWVWGLGFSWGSP